jgi:predicted RNA-binding Zn-ribbon protein involved in translation (DUF1610 family)
MNDWYDTPEPRLDPPEPVAVCQCALCGEDIYEGETCYELGLDFYCENCIEDCKRTAERVMDYD